MRIADIPTWWDEFHGAYARNIGRVLVGRRFTQEPEADEFSMTPGYDFAVARVSSVTVGIDSDGIFAGITVRDLTEAEWTFYSNGTVANGDDETVGTHSLALGPDPSQVVGRKPAGPLFDLAVGLARAEESS